MVGETPLISEEMVQQATAFHGHLCPGLAMGIRAAEIALRELGRHSEHDELLAQVETDMCAVDAIQLLTGCTFGRGNLIYRDYGKNAYTFYRPSQGRAFRIASKPTAGGPMGEEHQALWQKLRDKSMTPEEKPRFWQLQNARAKAILAAPLDTLYAFTEPSALPARRNGAPKYVRCEQCGEMVAEHKSTQHNGKTLCIPCARAHR